MLKLPALPVGATDHHSCLRHDCACACRLTRTISFSNRAPVSPRSLARPIPYASPGLPTLASIPQSSAGLAHPTPATPQPTFTATVSTESDAPGSAVSDTATCYKASVAEKMDVSTVHQAHGQTQSEGPLPSACSNSLQVAAASTEGAVSPGQTSPSMHSAPPVHSHLDSSSTSATPSGGQGADAQQGSAAAFLDDILSQAKRGTLFKGRAPMRPPADPSKTPAQVAVAEADRDLATAEPSRPDNTIADAAPVTSQVLDPLKQPSAPEPECHAAYAGPATNASHLLQHQNSARDQPAFLPVSTPQELLHSLSRKCSSRHETRPMPATALGETRFGIEQESLAVSEIGQEQAELSSAGSGFGCGSSIRQAGRLLSHGSSREGDFASLLLPGCVPSRASLGGHKAC